MDELNCKIKLIGSGLTCKYCYAPLYKAIFVDTVHLCYLSRIGSTDLPIYKGEETVRLNKPKVLSTARSLRVLCRKCGQHMSFGLKGNNGALLHGKDRARKT